MSKIADHVRLGPVGVLLASTLLFGGEPGCGDTETPTTGGAGGSVGFGGASGPAGGGGTSAGGRSVSGGAGGDAGICGSGCLLESGDVPMCASAGKVTLICSPPFSADLSAILQANGCTDAGTSAARYCCPPQILNQCA